jgi:hypothetical protein
MQGLLRFFNTLKGTVAAGEAAAQKLQDREAAAPGAAPGGLL